ncbi:hypothetical protein [Marinobacter sp. MBR-105]
MARQSRTMKRVRIYLDSADPDQALILQHFEAMEELSTFDRNQWFVNALRDYQAKLTTPGYKADSLSELRHQMMAHFLKGRTVSVDDLIPSPQSMPTHSAPSSPAGSSDHPIAEVGQREPVTAVREAATVASADSASATSAGIDGLEDENDGIEQEESQPADSPLRSRLASLM